MTAGCILVAFLVFCSFFASFASSDLLSRPWRLRRALSGISDIELVTEPERETSLLARYDYDVRKFFSDMSF